MSTVKDYKGNIYHEDIETGKVQWIKERGQIEKDVFKKKVSHYIGIIEDLSPPLELRFKYVIYNLITTKDLENLLENYKGYYDVQINLNGTEAPGVKDWLDQNANKME